MAGNGGNGHGKDEKKVMNFQNIVKHYFNNSENFEELYNQTLAIGELIKAVKPMVDSLAKAVATYGPDIESSITKIGKGIARIRWDIFKQYMDCGFSRAEAFRLLMEKGSYIDQVVKNVAEEVKMRKKRV